MQGAKQAAFRVMRREEHAPLFVEVPVNCVREDGRFPDQDTRYVYEHLKYTLSRPRQFALPAIRLSVVAGEAVITAGHKYLRIARELGIAHIRAVISWSGAERSPGAVVSSNRMAADLESPGWLLPGARVVPSEELEREMSLPVSLDYHVYFFEQPLSLQAQQEFVRTFVGFFERLATPLLAASGQRVLRWDFPFEARCAEFQALVPVGDPAWPAEYLRVSQEFSRRVARIVSFQGARFPQ